MEVTAILADHEAEGAAARQVGESKGALGPTTHTKVLLPEQRDPFHVKRIPQGRYSISWLGRR